MQRGRETVKKSGAKQNLSVRNKPDVTTIIDVSDRSSDDKLAVSKKTGKISCIFLFPSWESVLLRCEVCFNFSFPMGNVMV